VSLRLRIGGLLVVLALLLSGTALAVAGTVRDYDGQRVLISERLQPASSNSRALLTSLINQETGERGFLITGRESFLQPYIKGRARFRPALLQLEHAFVDDPEVTDRIAAVRLAARHWHRTGIAPEVAARRAGNTLGAQSLVAQGQSKSAFDVVRREVDALQKLIDSRLNAARAVANTAFSSIKQALLASGALLVALVILTCLLLRRWVLVPVKTLRASMREVAQGRIDQPVRVIGPPEVAAIGNDAEDMRRRIVFELDTARGATEALLQHSPVVAGLRNELAARSIDDLQGVRVFGALHPAEGVLAGDWWEAVRRTDGRTALVVADVAGHGAAAGLVALRFKERLTALLRTDLDLLTAFTTAARDLDEDPEKFLSCVLIEVDASSGVLRWINAGHSAALVARRAGADVKVLDLAPTGPLVGALEQQWCVSETALRPGDLLIAMTDGVVEARRGDEQEFGVAGVLDTLRRQRSWSPRATVTELVEAVRLFADDWRRDDVTLVALELVSAADRFKASEPGPARERPSRRHRHSVRAVRPCPACLP
jgi:CHASE3 domain sensor protein